MGDRYERHVLHLCLKYLTFQVIDQLDILRSILTNLDNITFHVATDVNRLVQLVGDPTIAWNPHFLLPSGDSSCKLLVNIKVVIFIGDITEDYPWMMDHYGSKL